MDMGHERWATWFVLFIWLLIQSAYLKVSGYDKALVPVQVLPRKVSSIVKPVHAIAMTVRWIIFGSRMRMTSGVGNPHGVSTCHG